jgi:hypothetical protein
MIEAPLTARQMTESRPRLLRPAIVGLAGWTLASLAIRLAPAGALHLPSLGFVAATLAACTALAAFARWIVRGVGPVHRPAVMVAIVLPGMLGDALASACFPRAFPNLPPAAAPGFGALMLLGYAIMLIASLGPSGAGVAAA